MYVCVYIYISLPMRMYIFVRTASKSSAVSMFAVRSEDKVGKIITFMHAEKYVMKLKIFYDE